MVYEQLAALCLDKQCFGRAFLAYTVEVLKELWPDDCKGIECPLKVQQSVTKFETVLSTVKREMMKDLPFKRLESSSAVKQLSFAEQERAREVLLVFSSPSGETTMLCNRTYAKILNAAFNVIHAKALMKEAFLQQSHLITTGNKKNTSANSAIWAFTAERYWKRLAKDIAAVVDHSDILKHLNTPHV